MGNTNSTESPLEAAAGVAGQHVTETLSVLCNETRLAILLALWEAADPFAEGRWDPQSEKNVLSFSDLRGRVGMRDSGQFNYHLRKLEGRFVEHTPDGYQLLPAGAKIVRTVVASAGFEEASLPPTVIDLTCPNCGSPTAVTYHNQRVYWVCTTCDGVVALGDKHPSGVLGAWIAYPAILSHRAPDAIYAARQTGLYHEFAQFAVGVCPWCMGQVDRDLHVCDAHDRDDDEVCPACGRQTTCAARFVCTVCKVAAQSLAPLFSEHHPAVSGFYWKHGIDLNNPDTESLRRLKSLREEVDQELVSTEPPRLRITFRHEEDELQLTHDENLNVVAVDESR